MGETIQVVHERFLRRLFKEEFNVTIPEDLTTDEKQNIKSKLYMKNMKAVTAKFPDNQGTSTVILDNHKRFIKGQVIANVDGEWVETRFNEGEVDKFVEAIGEEVYRKAQTYRTV
jgi:hypothetical protein